MDNNSRIGNLVVAKQNRPVFLSNLRTEAQRVALRAICQPCNKRILNYCGAAHCCGGKLPLETMYNLSTTHCPLKLW